jgi:hypothetical protein
MEPNKGLIKKMEEVGLLADGLNVKLALIESKLDLFMANQRIIDLESVIGKLIEERGAGDGGSK